MKHCLLILLICFISSASFCKDLASFTLTITDRFDKKGIPNAKVELHSTGKRAHLLKTLYSNEAGIVQFDSLANGWYYYSILSDGYIQEMENFQIDKGWSFETSEELDLTDDRKGEILLPYIFTKEEALNLTSILSRSCKDSTENQSIILSKGFPEFNKKLNEIIRYPPEAQEMGIEGKINVTFLVSETGEILKVGAYPMGDPSLMLEALLTVLLIDHFEPSICNGERVKSVYTVPLTFTLN